MMRFEKSKWFGEEFERETFESLVERKASSLEFSLNGFIRIEESECHADKGQDDENRVY